MIETFPAGVYVFKVNIRYNIQHDILNFIKFVNRDSRK